MYQSYNSFGDSLHFDLSLAIVERWTKCVIVVRYCGIIQSNIIIDPQQI